MASVVFIHGTGVRQEGHDQTLVQIRNGVQNAGITAQDVHGCLWGDLFGVRLDLIEHMLPLLGAKAIEGVLGSDDQENVLWAALLDDPLFELRVAGMFPKTEDVGFIVGEMPATQKLLERKPALELITVADMGITTNKLRTAVKKIIESPEATKAATAARAYPFKDAKSYLKLCF